MRQDSVTGTSGTGVDERSATMSGIVQAVVRTFDRLAAEKQNRAVRFAQPGTLLFGKRPPEKVQSAADVQISKRSRIRKRAVDPVVRNPGIAAVENRNGRTSVAVADLIVGNRDLFSVDGRRNPVGRRSTAAAHDQNRRNRGVAESTVVQTVSPDDDVSRHRPLQPEKFRFEDDSVEGDALNAVSFDPAVGGFEQNAPHMTVVKMIAPEYRPGAATAVTAGEVAGFDVHRPVEPDAAERSAGEILQFDPEFTAVQFFDAAQPLFFASNDIPA